MYRLLRLLVLGFALLKLALLAALAAAAAADGCKMSLPAAGPARLVLELAVLLRVPEPAATQASSCRRRGDRSDVHWSRLRRGVHRRHVGVDGLRQLRPSLWAS